MTHDETILPKWVRAVLYQLRGKVDAMARERNAMEAAYRILQEHSWFTLPGPSPQEAKADPRAVRKIWYLSNEGAHLACDLYPGDILLVGRDKTRVPPPSAALCPVMEYVDPKYHVSDEDLDKMFFSSGPLPQGAQLMANLIMDARTGRKDARAMRLAVNKVYWYAKHVKRTVRMVSDNVQVLQATFLAMLPTDNPERDRVLQLAIHDVNMATEFLVEAHATVPDAVLY